MAFRRIYREAWKARNRRPDRRTIRRILSRQLAGFDVSEDALRLGALSLYLTALELDPRPQPLSEVKFENLQDRVLFNVRRPGVGQGHELFVAHQRQGVRSRFVNFSDEGHWVLKPRNSRFWHEEVFRWLNEFAPGGA